MTQSDLVKTRIFRNPLDGPILFIARRFGGSRSKELERFLKFAVVGVTGAIVDFGMLILLQATILPPKSPVHVAIATTIAFGSAVINNFTWTRLWVYPDSRSRSIKRQLTQFAVVSVIGGVARTTWIAWAYKPLGEFLLPILLPEIQLLRPGYVPSPHAAAKLGSIAAQTIGMAVVMVWNFAANRYWTYNDVE